MLKEKLDSLIRESMLSKNNNRTEVLRAIKAKFTEWETSKNAKPLDEQTIIRKMISDRANSAEIYDKAGRKDLASKELIEIEYLLEFKEDDVTEEQIKDTILNLVNSGKGNNLGEIMKGVKEIHPTADMKIASAIARTL